MLAAPIPDDEQERQASVNRYCILNTPSDPRFDDITEMMSQVSGAPICLITILDHERNWMKSHHGIDLTESPRNISFCGHAIVSSEPMMIVEDARNDSRFFDNPLVTEFGAEFYAGVPIQTNDGHKFGTLCLFDTKPRTLDDKTRKLLLNMARQVEALLELHLNNKLLTEAQTLLIQHNNELKQFAGVVSHDLKTPIYNIVMIADLLSENANSALDEEERQDLLNLKKCSFRLARYIDGILEYYTCEQAAEKPVEQIALDTLFVDVESLAGQNALLEWVKPDALKYFRANKSVLMQVLNNLISNAVKYNDNETVRVIISLIGHPEKLEVEVSDNGRGIAAEKLDRIFDHFVAGSDPDRYGNQGTGIGLGVVRKILTAVGGEISVQSIHGQGSTFTFFMPGEISS